MDAREKVMELLKVAPYNSFGNKLGERCFTSCLGMIADYLITNGVTVLEWISVDDRLPVDQEEVLVCTRSKNGIRNIDKGYMAIDRFIHRGRAEVTHWMPLPPLPKGE